MEYAKRPCHQTFCIRIYFLFKEFKNQHYYMQQMPETHSLKHLELAVYIFQHHRINWRKSFQSQHTST